MTRIREEEEVREIAREQEKPTEIITVIKFPLFVHNIGNCDFQYQKFS